jgi:hypothetical protein
MSDAYVEGSPAFEAACEVLPLALVSLDLAVWYLRYLVAADDDDDDVLVTVYAAVQSLLRPPALGLLGL